MKEAELFEPIKAYFEEQGYIVDGEVSHVDMVARKDDIQVAIELKNEFNFKVLEQASERQKYNDYVFIGIWIPKNMKGKAFRQKVYLLKRLGIGLLVVSKQTKIVELYNEPVIVELERFKTRNKRKKNTIQEEFNNRSLKCTTGGVTRKTIMTAYKENVLRIVNALFQMDGRASTKQIREVTHIENATSILYNNFNGYFKNVEKGVYELTPSGYQAYEEYYEIIQRLKEAVE